MSRWIITATDQIDEYMLEQPDPDRLIVHLELHTGANAADATQRVGSAVERGLTEFGLRLPGIEFRVGPVQRGRGKYKRFRRGFASTSAG
jgi:hypothetical protein